VTAQARVQARRDAFHDASASTPGESPDHTVREHRAHGPRAVTDRRVLVALWWSGRVYREKPSQSHGASPSTPAAVPSGDREQKEPGQ
jgi:hypothetical protein